MRTLPLTALRCVTALGLLGVVTGQKTFHGFARKDFELAGQRCTVVRPKQPAPGRPWIYRARFFGHQPQTEIELLRRGFHVVYTNVAGLFGNDEALQRWSRCYAHVTSELQLHKKPALLGMSRGGLIALRWAERHPDKVACIYLDAPVCDIRSWPGGKGKGKGSPKDWQRCLAAHAITAAAADDWAGNPIRALSALAQARVPILSICGDADRVVPFAENTAIVAKRYRELGGPIRVIAKKGVGHHPHSLTDPTPIVGFILRHTVGSGDYFVTRDGLARCRTRWQSAQRGRVAFLGGSITHNPGWRNMVADDLQKRFPKVAFDFVQAGIPSFGSTPGAFRFASDVLAKGKVDLLFVEAAVNDSTNGRSADEMTRGMEGIVRRAFRANPAMDIVMMHFVDPAKMRTFNRGLIPTVIRRHEAVAAHYRIPSIDLALEVTERIEAGEFTWKDDFRNLHPSPFGQRLYAATIRRLFDRALAASNKPTTRELRAPIDPKCYDAGRYVAPDGATKLVHFKMVPKWRPKDRAGTRAGFVNVPMLVAEQPAASLEFRFRGRAIGILCPAGPDAGIVEFSIDGAPYKEIDLFTRWSRGLHLPWSHVLAADLADGPHRLSLRVVDKKNPRSKGHAVRIRWFLVNGE